MHLGWANPIALTALLPWAAAFAWLHRSVPVASSTIPFLPLWRATATPARTARIKQVPPLAIILMWMAAGTAILAAAAPQIVWRAVRTVHPLGAVTWVRLAARAKPFPQVMVETRNGSDAATARFRVETAGRTVEQNLPLGPRGTVRRQFIDLPALGPTVGVTLGGHSLVASPETGWPTLVMAGALPEPVRRFVSVYTALRPPAGVDLLISSADAVESTPSAGPSIEIVDGPGAAPSLPLQVMSHPATADVRTWPGPADRNAVPPPGFSPIVRGGGAVLVAVAESPVRRVWLNVDESIWGDSDDNVVLLTDAVQWAGRATEPIYRAAVPPHGPSAARPSGESPPAYPLTGCCCTAALLLAAGVSWSGVVVGVSWPLRSNARA